MDGDQVRQALIYQVPEHMRNSMEYDTDGSGLDHFTKETQDRKEWGGYGQIAIFVRTYQANVEIISFGSCVQTYDGAEHMHEQETIIALF
eukprot:7880905-Heterocapsa_arctica.AAC.1